MQTSTIQISVHDAPSELGVPTLDRQGRSPQDQTFPNPSNSPIRCQLDMQQLLELFHMAAFWAKERRVEDLAVAIAHSNPVVSAWHQDHLIGFARATSDGVYRATIWDVVVHPDFQAQGIGRKLVQTVLSHPHISQVERVYLMTTFKEKFYERVGFQRNNSTTMVLHQQPMGVLPTRDLDETERRQQAVVNHQPIQAMDIRPSSAP